MERLLSLTLCFLVLCSPTFAKDSSREKSHDRHNNKHKHSVPPQAHLRVDSKPCQSPCTATLDASKSRAHKGATIVKYIFDYNDGSPLFESTSPIVTHEYSFVKETLSKKHKHRRNIKEFHPKVFVIDSNNKKSKSDREKVRIIAQTDTTPVNQAPVAKLVLTPNSGVAPLSVTLDASGSSDDKGIVLYTFEFGDGETISSTNPSITHTYAAGNFSAKVSVFDVEGLTSSATASITVTVPNTAPIANLSATPLTGDAPLTVTFNSSASTDDKAVVSRVYSFGDGQSLTSNEAVVSHVYQAAGNYSAKVSVFDVEGLTSSATASVTVTFANSAPVASLSANSTRQNPNSVFHFDGSASSDANNNISSYTLTNLSNNIAQSNSTGLFDVTLTDPGSYNFELVVTDALGLTGSATLNVAVNAPPSAMLSSDKLQGLAPLTVSFDSSASSDDLAISKRFYIFENSLEEESSLEVISHTFNNLGTYSVALRVQDADGLEASTSIEITVSAPPVNQAPIANLSATPLSGDAPLTVTFDSSASSDDKAIVNRVFTFGDGQSLTTTEAVVSHTYLQSGNFSASVQVLDQENLSSSKSVSIEVKTPNTAPIASLSVDKIRANPGASFKFDGSASSDAENNVVSFTLSNSVLGINQTNTTGIFDVVISQSGNFDFIFTVADSFGLSDSKTMSISVNTPPIALLSADKISGEAPLTVTFDSSASSDDVSIVKRDYQFAPNVFALNAGSSVSYTYNEVGVYPVKVQIYDGENLISEAMVEITVTAPEIKTPPIAWFQIEADPNTGLVRLKNQAIAGSSNITSVSYLVNNQISLSSAIYAYSEASFQAEGGLRYDIKQIVTDEQNQTSEEIISVVMDETQQTPVPQFTIAQSNVNQVFLNAIYSFDLLNSTTSMKVNWGDQTPEETLSSHFASHNYQNAGTYSVTLTLENSQSLTSSLTREITVTNSAPEALDPVANFIVLQDDTIKHIRLLSQYSASPNGEILSYFWQYGDGQVGYGEESIHFYEAGLYLARLTITDSMGVRASQVQQILITSSGPAIISKIDQCNAFGLYGECDFFVANKDKELDRVEVNWGDGSIDTYTVVNNEWQIFDAIGHNYQNSGTYDVTVSAITFSGLQATASSQVTAEGTTTANQVPVANINCYTIEYTNIQCDTFGSFDPDGFIQSYEISMGDGTIYNTDLVNHTYQNSGSYPITLKIVDNLGAESTTQTTVDVLVRQNLTPIAILDCYSPATHKLVCNGLFSTDNDGFITRLTYSSEDGEVFETVSSFEEVTFSFANGGPKTIALTVVDNEGASSEVSQTFIVKENIIPIANLSCASNNILELTCTDTGSYDPDGSIIEKKWIVNNSIEYTGDQFTHQFTTATSIVDVRLIVKDNFNDLGEAAQNIQVMPAPPSELNISCSESGNLRLSCSPLFQDSYRTPVTYKWIVNNILYESESIEVQFDISTEAIVSLEVETSFGDFVNATTTINLNDQGTGVGTSLIEASISQVDPNFFNPVLSEFEILLTQGNPAFDLTGLPEYFVLTLNEERVSLESILFEQGRIFVNQPLVEGYNTIDLSFKDEFGREFQKSWEFISGTQTIELNITDTLGNVIPDAKIHIAQKDSSAFILNYINTTTITNVPQGMTIIMADSPDSFGIESFEVTDTTPVIDLKVVSTSNLIAHESYDFEAGFDKWNIYRGLGETVLHDNSTSLVQYEEGQMDALISPDSSGVILGASLFSFSQETPYIAYPIDLQTKSPKTFFVGVVKNMVTGEVEFNISHADGGINPISGYIYAPVRMSVGSETGENKLLILYAKYFDNEVVGSNSKKQDLLNLIIDKAFAQTSSGVLKADPPVKSLLLSAEIFSQQFPNERLAGISLGTYPSIFPDNLNSTYINNVSGTIINPLIVEVAGLKINDIQNNTFDLVIQNTKGELIGSLPLHNYSTGKSLFVNIPSGWVSPTEDKYQLLVKVTPNDSTQSAYPLLTKSFFKQDTKIYKSNLYQAIIALGDELVNPATLNDKKYITITNADEGYDHWVAVQYYDLIRRLITRSDVKFGDFGGINGRQLLANGGRSGHVFGTDFDIEVFGTNAAGNNELETSEESAKKVIEIVNTLPNDIRLYLLMMKDDKPFKGLIDSSCSINGRRLNSIAVNVEGHANHHHISLYGGRNERPSNLQPFNVSDFLLDDDLSTNGVVVTSIPLVEGEKLNVLKDGKIYTKVTFTNLAASDELFYHFKNKAEAGSELTWTLASTDSKRIIREGSSVYIEQFYGWENGNVEFKHIRNKNGFCFNGPSQFVSLSVLNYGNQFTVKANGSPLSNPVRINQTLNLEITPDNIESTGTLTKANEIMITYYDRFEGKYNSIIHKITNIVQESEARNFVNIPFIPKESGSHQPVRIEFLYRETPESVEPTTLAAISLTFIVKEIVSIKFCKFADWNAYQLTFSLPACPDYTEMILDTGESDSISVSGREAGQVSGDGTVLTWVTFSGNVTVTACPYGQVDDRFLVFNINSFTPSSDSPDESNWILSYSEVTLCGKGLGY